MNNDSELWTRLTRREFLATSSLAVAGMTTIVRDAPVDSELLYIGTYTDKESSDGIHVVRLEVATGRLSHVAAIDGGPNPSFLAIHPAGHVLYAVNEVAEHDGNPAGAVSAFVIEKKSGALTGIGRQSSGGRGPCYVSVDRSGRAALVANYDSGSVALLPLDAAGALGAPASVVRHTGRGPNAQRQEAPHAHCIVAHRDNRFVLAADLGADRVLVYELSPRSKTLRQHHRGDATMPPGSGPRHLAFHPTLPLVFVTNELDSTVTSLRFDADRGVLTPIAATSTVPPDWHGENFPADIHVAPLGNVLYVSNRGHDSIAMFSIAAVTGAVTLAQTISTEGTWPRNFSVDPSGRWLVVANQNSGSLVVLARDLATGRLAPAQQRLALRNPACVRFRARGAVT